MLEPLLVIWCEGKFIVFIRNIKRNKLQSFSCNLDSEISHLSTTFFWQYS